MGVVDRFLEQGGSPTVVNMYVKREPLVRLKFQGFGDTAGRDAFAPRPIMIPQSETERLLGDAVEEQGGKIEWNTEFLDFTQDAHRVTSRIRRADGEIEHVESSYLVSCEGAHSLIRKQAGFEFAGKTYPLLFFMADVEADWRLDHDENHVWMHSDGSFAALPLPRPRTWRLFVEMSELETTRSTELTLESIRGIMAQRIEDHTTTLSNPTWISEFRIHCRLVDRYRHGRVFVAGDAAHIHSPTGGQGIATGIQDASNLAWKLGRVCAGAPETLLDSYEEERRPHAQEVLNETNRVTTVLFAPNWRLRMLRDYVVLPVLRSRWAQRKMFSKLAQLHVNYRASGLSQHEDATGPWRTTRLRAGDRAPDVAFRNATTGERVTLFELLQPMRPVVLLGANRGVTDVARYDDLTAHLSQLGLSPYMLVPAEDAFGGRRPHCLIDAHGDFQRLYGMSQEFLCLIRPDDHIGLFQRPIREGALNTYLTQICAPTMVRHRSAVTA
jgi:4,5-epoxidase